LPSIATMTSPGLTPAAARAACHHVHDLEAALAALDPQAARSHASGCPRLRLVEVQAAAGKSNVTAKRMRMPLPTLPATSRSASAPASVSESMVTGL
jgi:hypothetical protein